MAEIPHPRLSSLQLRNLAFAILAFILPQSVVVAQDANSTGESNTSSSSVIITTTSPINNLKSNPSSNNNASYNHNNDTNHESSKHAKQKLELAKHFLPSDINFLSRQSMILGGYYTNVDGKMTQGERKKCNRAACRDHEYSPDKEDRRDVLEFKKRSLLRELSYLRGVKEEMRKEEEEDEVLITESRIDDDVDDQVEQTQTKDEETEDRHDEKNIESHTSVETAILSNNVNCNDENKDECKPYSGENNLLGHDFDYSEMVHHLDCETHNNGEKPLYTEAMRKQLWQTFRENTLFPSYPIPEAICMDNSLFKVGYSEDRSKGRGAFATTFIPKGTMVNAALSNAVFFLNAWDFYRYLAALPSKEMACDVMDWVWMQEVISDSGNRVLCLNMDGEAFFNDGKKALSNVGKVDKASLVYYAKSDIQQGEEILFDYEYTAWELFDMDLDR